MVKLKPLIKWYGSKRRLLDRLFPLLELDNNPSGFLNEPFFGSGALSFHLLANNQVKFVFATDLNPALVNFYNSLARFENVLKVCKTHSEKHSYDYYYTQRDLDTSKLDRIQWAAWFHYMNKTGFNGLYRCNKSGGYSTPYNGVARYNPPNEDLMRTYARLMESVCLEEKPFIPSEIDCGLVYLDPPYYCDDRASRVDYGVPVFDHISFLQDVGDTKPNWVLSHKDNASFDELIMSQGYVKTRHEFDFQYVAAAKATSRTQSKEILYRSF